MSIAATASSMHFTNMSVCSCHAFLRKPISPDCFNSLRGCTRSEGSGFRANGCQVICHGRWWRPAVTPCRHTSVASSTGTYRTPSLSRHSTFVLEFMFVSSLRYVSVSGLCQSNGRIGDDGILQVFLEVDKHVTPSHSPHHITQLHATSYATMSVFIMSLLVV